MIIGSFIMIVVSSFFVTLMLIFLNSSNPSRPDMDIAILLLSLATGVSGFFLLKHNYSQYKKQASRAEEKMMRIKLMIIGSFMMIVVSLVFIALMIIVLNSNPSHPGVDIAIMLFFLAIGIRCFFMLKSNHTRYKEQTRRVDTKPQDRSACAHSSR